MVMLKPAFNTNWFDVSRPKKGIGLNKYITGIAWSQLTGFDR
jgi:hypothetical protein